MVMKSFYCHPEVYVRINGKQSKSFHVGVGLRQRLALSPFYNLHELGGRAQSNLWVCHDRKKQD